MSKYMFNFWLYVRYFHILNLYSFRIENEKSLRVYRRLQRGIPQFSQDFYKLLKTSDQIEALAKHVSTVIKASRDTRTYITATSGF